MIFILLESSFAKPLIKKIGFDDKQNIEITIDEKADFKTYALSNPSRIVVDVDAAYYNEISTSKSPNFIKEIRYSKSDKNVRIVFDLKQKTFIQAAKYEKLTGQKDGKIVVRIAPELSYIIASIDMKKNSVAKPMEAKKSKTPIIVIDAGHGGKDPGTIGSYARTKEKNITLSYAKELAKQLSLGKKYKVYLTRSSDVFIPLKERVAKARKVKADLFISLHANAAENHDAKGFSIYTLSNSASDKQAEMLARKENRADIISGINFSNASSDILKTLIDLSQRSSMNHSSRFANIAISKVRNNGVEIIDNTHRFAGFVVLTAPDMVSILIELGYLSNKNEEKDLNSLSHKRKVTQGLVDAIDKYFEFSKR